MQGSESRNVNPDLPRGSLTKNYGGVISAGAILIALLEIFREDPKSSIGLFAQFAPKYILWGGIAYMVYDLLKKTLRPLHKSADNMGLMAQNIGNVAVALNTLVTKSDSSAVETRRLCSFSAQQSERAVEVAHEVKDEVARTHALLVQLHGKFDAGVGETRPT